MIMQAPPRSPAPPVGAPSRRRAALRKIGAVFAAIAGLGAVLGGLAGYWTTYRIVTAELNATATTTGGPVTAAPKPVASRLSIAVLPFANLSGESTDDYFADGIVDDLTTSLSTHIPGLLVAGRGSAFSYKGKEVDPIQVGAKLGVHYLLLGSVRRVESQVRVNAQLVDAQSDSQVWAERFEAQSDNLVFLQDQIAARIANSLGTALIRAGANEAETRKTSPGPRTSFSRLSPPSSWATG